MSDEQIQFLVNLQRLLDEGVFVASYKFALIADALPRGGIVSELAVSNRIALWAYAQTEAAGGLTWLRKDEMVPLEERWRVLFAIMTDQHR